MTVCDETLRALLDAVRRIASSLPVKLSSTREHASGCEHCARYVADIALGDPPSFAAAWARRGRELVPFIAAPSAPPSTQPTGRVLLLRRTATVAALLLAGCVTGAVVAPALRGAESLHKPYTVRFDGGGTTVRAADGSVLWKLDAHVLTTRDGEKGLTGEFRELPGPAALAGIADLGGDGTKESVFGVSAEQESRIAWDILVRDEAGNQLASVRERNPERMAVFRAARLRLERMRLEPNLPVSETERGAIVAMLSREATQAEPGVGVLLLISRDGTIAGEYRLPCGPGREEFPGALEGSLVALQTDTTAEPLLFVGTMLENGAPALVVLDVRMLWGGRIDLDPSSETRIPPMAFLPFPALEIPNWGRGRVRRVATAWGEEPKSLVPRLQVSVWLEDDRVYILDKSLKAVAGRFQGERFDRIWMESNGRRPTAQERASIDVRVFDMTAINPVWR